MARILSEITSYSKNGENPSVTEERQARNASAAMTTMMSMLELSHKNFKVTSIRMLQQAIT